MRILVIGGAGHIGSNLVEHLASNEQFEEVISLDNYSNGSKENHVSNVEYIEGDARWINRINLPELDALVHLGEFARIEQSFENYEKVIENNTLGTLGVMRYCIEKNVKLIYSASSAISSLQERGLVNAPYTISKQANVSYISSLCHSHKLRHAIMYFFNVYGPKEKGTGENATVVEKFLQKKFSNEQAVIHGTGEQKRNFTDVRDVVSGIEKVIMKGEGDGYHIGCPRAYSVLELAKLIGVEYALSNTRLGNRTSSNIDLTKMTDLGWESKYHLGDYIRERLLKGQ